MRCILDEAWERRFVYDGPRRVGPGRFQFTDDGRLHRLGHVMFGLSVFSLFLLAAQGSSTGGWRITGRVADAVSGAPISGARVTLTMVVDVPGGTFGRRPRQSITDADGAFAFDGLELAQYILDIEKTGFASYPDVLGDGPPERLTVDTMRRSASFMPMMAMADDDGTFTIGEVAPERVFAPDGSGRNHSLGGPQSRILATSTLPPCG